MIKSFHHQVVALAGLSQATRLVQQIAKQGDCDAQFFEASMASLLKIDADSVEDVYGGIAGVKLGLKQLENQLYGRDRLDHEQARYSACLIYLERKLSQQPGMLRDIRSGIERAALQAAQLTPTHENVLSIFAETYQNSLSTLHPRVMISGEPAYLTRPLNVDKIRSLLLAGIRAAVLWQQCGGSRWKFIFVRGKMLAETRRLLESL